MRCQLVLASEVAGARASEPDSAIVALAPSNRADLVLQAQLDGADIVIPDDADSRTLEQAMTAARRLATRHFSAMSDYRSAVHELGTSFLSLGMLAEVFEAEGAYPLRVDQLRRVVDEGRALTWRAGRLGRVQAGPISEFDVSLALAGYATPDTEDRVGPAISVCTDGPSPTLIDLSEFVAAIDAVIENSMLSGAETIQLRVTNCEDAVEVTFVDDGLWTSRGLASRASPRPLREWLGHRKNRSGANRSGGVRRRCRRRTRGFATRGIAGYLRASTPPSCSFLYLVRSPYSGIHVDPGRAA